MSNKRWAFTEVRYDQELSHWLVTRFSDNNEPISDPAIYADKDKARSIALRTLRQTMRGVGCKRVHIWSNDGTWISAVYHSH